MTNRRNFLRQVSGVMITAAGSTITGGMITGFQTLIFTPNYRASNRIFVARFAHETNTFHPVPTSSWRFSETGRIKMNSWENTDFNIISGVSASPNGGGLLLEKPCREAMDHVLSSLREAMPINAVFLYLHGAMYAEGVGHAETAELEEGVSRALAAKESTVFLTDSGDNVTASTPGDLPLVLRHLVERRVGSAVVACINDAAATQRCFKAGEGSRIHISIGATIEKRHGPPFEAEVEVIRLVQQPRMAVTKIDAIEVILTEGPTTFTNLAQFELCRINPLERKIVVVKMGYLYPGLTRIAPRYIMLLTPGAGDMRIEKLTYTRLRRPIFPLDPDTQFDLPKINL